mmetsp:Transcript_4600/g.10105  ORF Transcript_4600/g.10105 Transcript_4600/m.10105 type:complete len:461 (-) Transcript_4600:217-1599(-)
MSAFTTTYEYCDADALPAETTTVTSLLPDQFYKLCPGQQRHTNNGTNVPLGQPRCGDGTNYSFLLSRPAPQHQQKQKIAIELTGGGACWDGPTCTLQRSMLSFPPWLSSAFVGTNCSDFLDFQFDSPLCAKTIGDVDFSTYTTVVIPYCTQDVHMGDEPNVTYYDDEDDGDDGNNGSADAIHHVGAHNMYRTLQWIFENFPNPSQIFVTGCSAGGTPQPIIYDLINTHYGGQAVNIDVIMDSPVYLTPSYFLENYFPNWNVGTILKKVGFDFDTHRNEESLPDLILDYALKRSKETDNIGFVTHDNDQISLLYFTLMSGSLAIGGRDRRSLSSIDPSLLHKSDIKSTTSNSGRKMVSDIQSQWWSGINNSMTLAMEGHSNLDVFIIEGDGHCSFSLNVPLQYDGFEEWASNLVRESSPTSPLAVDQIAATNNLAALQASSSFAIATLIVLAVNLLSLHAH